MNTQNNIQIVIQEKNGQNVVSARELYEKLGYNTTHWSKWYKKNIENNPFAIKNEDYTQLALSARTKDFALTIDFAKRLSMLARTEQGENVRQYFIAKEKEVQDLKLQLVEQNNKQIQELKEGLKVLQIETRLQSGNMTIKGFAKLIKANLERKDYPALGKFASKVCRKNGYEMGYTNHTEFGSVKTYPKHILERVFKSYLG